MSKHLRIARFSCWSVLTGVLSGFASAAVLEPSPATASSPQLEWLSFDGISTNHYVDNQERAHAVRLVAGVRTFGDIGFTKWCIAVDGQPFKMLGSWGGWSGYHLTGYVSYYGLIWTELKEQTEPGCWNVYRPENQSYYLDISVPVFSFSEGTHSITITGHDRGGTTPSKTIVFKKIAPSVVASLVEETPKIDSSVLSGSRSMAVTDSRMRDGNVGMGHEKICLSISPQPQKPILDYAKPLFAYFDGGQSAVATRQGDCWLGEKIQPNASGIFYGPRWQGVRFTLDTLHWLDANYVLTIDAHRWDTQISRLTVKFQTNNPPLDVAVSGVTENENVIGLRAISVGALISSGHASQITPSKYCVDVDAQSCALTMSTSSPSATFNFVSQLYRDGAHSLKFRAIDSAGREASKTVILRTINGEPVLSGVKVSTTKPAGPNGRSSALVSFNAPRSSAATVEVGRNKANATAIDADLTSSTDGSSSVNFENLQPSTKFSYQITARNANGQSKTVKGTFTTPAAPKRVSSGGGGGGGSGSSSGSGMSVVGWRLDRALAALGWSRSQAAEASGCPNKSWFGIVNLDNWIVVAQTSSTLYACKN